MVALLLLLPLIRGLLRCCLNAAMQQWLFASMRNGNSARVPASSSVSNSYNEYTSMPSREGVATCFAAFLRGPGLRFRAWLQRLPTLLWWQLIYGLLGSLFGMEVLGFGS